MVQHETLRNNGFLYLADLYLFLVYFETRRNNGLLFPFSAKHTVKMRLYGRILLIPNNLPIIKKMLGCALATYGLGYPPAVSLAAPYTRGTPQK
jgi:hypothetical protein